jgi:hypothetical protein
MYNEDTPYKVKEIIHDTWPQLFWLRGIKKSDEKQDDWKSRTRGKCDE